jgi:hypothetical protein
MIGAESPEVEPLKDGDTPESTSTPPQATNPNSAIQAIANFIFLTMSALFPSLNQFPNVN